MGYSLRTLYETIEKGDVPRLRLAMHRYSLLELTPNVPVAVANETLLSYAVQCNQPEMVFFLLEQGANPNTPNAKDLPPLYLALMHSHYPIALMLLKAGADVDFIDHEGRALHDMVAEAETEGKFLVSLGKSHENFEHLYRAVEALTTITTEFIVHVKSGLVDQHDAYYPEVVMQAAMACVGRVIARDYQHEQLSNSAERIDDIILKNGFDKPIEWVLSQTWAELIHFTTLLFADQESPFVKQAFAIMETKLGPIFEQAHLLLKETKSKQVSHDSKKEQVLEEEPLPEETDKVLDEVAEAIVDYRVMEDAIKSLSSMYTRMKM